MAGATDDAVYLDGLAAGDHGHAVVSSADDGLGDLDVGGAADVDAVGVGAVGRRRYPHVAYAHVLAREDVEVGALAVDRLYVLDPRVPHEVESQRLHMKKTNQESKP